jgi:hypothetical protein
MVNDMIENIAISTKAIEELVNIIVNIDVLLKRFLVAGSPPEHKDNFVKKRSQF